ncbi:MAG: isoprenylcysteine carboxylmethyltransferase family protein [Candidatus Omnitrophica bacterium]|nr:isoprenylcysteine carboxylmethyltransferase family protein [Candidatus Omnitrophota bacterium]
MKKRLKVNGIIMFLAFSVVLIFPMFFLRGGEKMVTFWDQAAELFGVAFIFMGQLFRVSARGFKAENSKEGFALVENGPYSLIRNPMYLGIFLIGLGVVLILFKLWVLLVFIVVFTIRYVTLMIKEEKKLTEFFPDLYPAYCKKVPQRIIPSLGAFLDKDISEYLPLRLAWVYKEIGSIIAVLSITFIVEAWMDIKTKGTVVYLKESNAILGVVVLFICFIFYLIWKTNNKNETASR